MDDKLKEAITAVREGDTKAAQRQLTKLLDENPQQVQGWYLLSLLVDSPQKQAAYLSKTLALNPGHEKAKEQLAALRATGSLAPTSTIQEKDSVSLDVVAQADSDQLPDWLQEHGGEQPVAIRVADTSEDTAVANDILPDWLKEPASIESDDTAVVDTTQESPTVVGQTAVPSSHAAESDNLPQQTIVKSQPKAAKATRPKPQSTRNLNIILGLLILVAVLVILTLAYLLLS